MRTRLRTFVSRPLVRVILLAVSLVTLAYQPPFAAEWTQAGVTASGLHDWEERSTRRPFRWTDGNAYVWFSGIGQQPYRLVMSLGGSRPNASELPAVRVFANETLLASFRAPRNTQDLSLDIPAGALDPCGDLRVRIESDTFSPPNDLRALGVTVSALRIETVGSARGFVLPPTAPFWLGVFAVAMLFQALRERQLPERVAWFVSVLALVILSAGVVADRLLTAAVLPWMALVSVVVYALAER